MPFMGHVFKGVQGCQGPQNCHQSGKHHAKAIDLEGNGKVVYKMHHMEGLCGASQQQRPNHQRGQQHHCFDINQHPAPLSEGQQRNPKAAQNRQRNGRQNQNLIHSPPPLTAPALRWL